jgi:hypothetical protein
MRYIVPMLADADKNPVGLFSLQTAAGDVVIVFANKARWDRFAGAVTPVLRQQDQFLASVTFEEESIDDVADRLLEMDPSLDKATFVPDTAPLYDDAVGMFERGG